MALDDFTFEYNGLLMGKGTNVRITSIAGLDDWEVTTNSVTVPRGDGNIPGDDYVNAKMIELTMQIVNPSDGNFTAVQNAFLRQTASSPFKFKLPNRDEKLVFVRPHGRAVVHDPSAKFMMPISVRLRADDPRIYGVNQISGVLRPFNPSSGGTDYAKDGDTDYVGNPTSGELVLTNNGNVDAYPIIRLYGPQDGGSLTGFTIFNVTTGAQADFNFSTTMLAPDIFTVDMNRIVTVQTEDGPYINLNGDNRYSNWVHPRDIFSLRPGSNTLHLMIDGSTADTSCVVIYRHTSL